MGDPVRYRCAGCGNVTRFDVVAVRRTRAFHHYSLAGELIVEDERNGRKRKQNKRALVLALSVVEPQTLRLVTELTLDGSVRPEDILRFLGLDPTEARITREAIEIEPEKSARTASG